MSIHWEHAQFLHNNSACPTSQHLIQNRITAAQPRTAPQQKWRLLSKSPLRLKFCMVTREELQEHWLGRMLPRAVKTASREVPPASATTHTQNWSRNQQAKDHQQPITNSQGRYRPTQLLSPGRTLVHHKPEKPYMAQSWESTSHWDPPFSSSQAALSFRATGQGALGNSEAGRMWSLLPSHNVFELDSWRLRGDCGPAQLRADPCTKRSLVRL